MTPAGPNRPARGRGPRRAFGSTWWGREWVRALETRARLDPNRLPRGRTYLRHGRVGALTAVAGEVRAPVRGSRDSAYRVRLRVRAFSGEEWTTALDAIAARAAHAAALLDGDLDPAIVEDLDEAGIELLPGPGEVATSCSCPDWANPCKHAAALCYLVADLLDDDPFTLLLLRGRSREEVLAGLRARRAGSAGDATSPSIVGDEPDPGVVAAAALARAGASLPPLPRPPLAPDRPGRPAPLAVDEPAGAATTAAALASLAADAAERAWALATGVGDGGLDLDATEDLARRAAQVVGSSGLEDLSRASGASTRTLVGLAVAWRHGGAGAVRVLEDHWDPPPEAMDEARRALADQAAAPRVRVGANRVSGAGIQLRYGRDGLWYRVERRGRTVEVVAPPEADPVHLVRPDRKPSHVPVRAEGAP